MVGGGRDLMFYLLTLISAAPTRMWVGVSGSILRYGILLPGGGASQLTVRSPSPILSCRLVTSTLSENSPAYVQPNCVTVLSY